MSDDTTDALALVEVGRAACRAYGRDDLLPRLDAAEQLLRDPKQRVLVVGEFKQGKSSLINALLNVDVCPVDDDIATSVPTAVTYSDEPSAIAWFDDERSEPVDVAHLTELVSEAGNPDNHRAVRLVEVGVARQLLGRGMTMVDTPGVGGLGSVHGALTIAALPTADAVILVTDASQELTAPEVRFLQEARDLCPTIIVVVTKCDLYPSWRKVVDLDREHLDGNGFDDVPLLAVSSALRRHALDHDDRAANEESGYPALVSHLRSAVIESGERLSVKAAAAAVRSIAAHLLAQLDAQRRALHDPEAAAALTTELQEAEERVERLRSESAGWQTVLNDGVGDLNADVDHDFRSRLRDLTAEAEARVDDGDPGTWWAEFETWIRSRVAEEVTSSYRVLATRSEALAAQVAERFAAAEEEVGVGVDVATPTELLASFVVPDVELGGGTGGLRKRAAGALTTGFSAVRGSYGSYTMFSMIGGLIGLAAMSPAVVGLTLLMGRKSVREERQKALGQRRAQAKTAVRRYLDEVSFQIGKDSRDALRRVQRQLRDGFDARATELQRTVAARVEGSKQAATTSASERAARLRDVDAEISRVREMASRAAPLAS